MLGEGFHQDKITICFHQTVQTASDWRARETSQGPSRNNRELDQQVQQVSKGPGGDNAHRMPVELLNESALQIASIDALTAQFASHSRVAYPLQAGYNVPGFQRIPVVKGHVGTQVEGPGTCIVFQRPALSQCRKVAATSVVAH